jgi:ABC-type branched-subunit amino acid transport system substrate-binding protein
MASEVGRRCRVVAAVVVAALAGALVVAAGAANDSGSRAGRAAAGTVKLGLITAVTGPLSVYYPAVKQATALAVDQLNASGGVLGKKVELIVADDKSSPQTAAAESRRLVQQHVAAVVHMGGAFSREASIPVFARAKILYLLAWAHEDVPSVCAANVWATGQVPSDWVPSSIAYAVHKLGLKNWIFLGSDYNYPHNMNAVARKTLESVGAKVLSEDYTPFGTTDFASVIAKLLPKLQNQPHTGLLVNEAGSDLIAFMKQFKAAGGDLSRSFSYTLDEQTSVAIGSSAKGALASFDYFAALKTPENKRFLAQISKQYGKSAAIPTWLSVGGYDAIHLWALAAQKAGSFDYAKITNALRQVSFVGPRGEVKFGENRHIALPNAIGRANADGRFTVLATFPRAKAVVKCR